MIISIMFFTVFMFCAWKVSQYEKALISIMDRLAVLENRQAHDYGQAGINENDSEVQSVILPEKQ